MRTSEGKQYIDKLWNDTSIHTHN